MVTIMKTKTKTWFLITSIGRLAQVAGFARTSPSFSSATQAPTSSRRPVSMAISDGAAREAGTGSWAALQSLASCTKVGAALDAEAGMRAAGGGAPQVQNTLRLFGESGRPQLTLYRDHAGWCPYCEKAMLLVEEKRVPINVELVPMRSYGDKPSAFLKLVPSGLLPALLVETSDGRKQTITESQVIMELIDRWHPVEDGYRQMMPADDDAPGKARYQRLANLERDLFSWWCTLIFRPEGPLGSGGVVARLTGASDAMSGAMKGFLDCLAKVDEALASTSGPWFFDYADHPTMMDFIYVSHVERMLASCAYWKGLDLRSDAYRRKFPAVNAWLDAFDRRESYLAFKSDYYTHVMDIPPQYGPGYDGGPDVAARRVCQNSIRGRDGTSWTLPLPHDDPLQPLYRGPPLPLCALKAAGIAGDNGCVGAEDTAYEGAEPERMAAACRHMAGWKLAGNGPKVAAFAARGGPEGAKNRRKTFGAELADPYAASDEGLLPHVDVALRAVCGVLLAQNGSAGHAAALAHMPAALGVGVSADQARDVAGALCYLRDRTGVPRDLPLAAARQLRAHLNAAIDVLQ